MRGVRGSGSPSVQRNIERTEKVQAWDRSKNSSSKPGWNDSVYKRAFARDASTLRDPRVIERHRKIVLGPDSKKAVVFITYSGYEFGPKEAKPSMQLLALEVEHLSFKCIGQFCCPGKFLHDPTPRTFHGDIRDRPNEKDLRKAEIFIEKSLRKFSPEP